ncbi:MAG: hypothetical protein ACTSR8_08055 [Promethearchaeota archaeon]
MIEEFWIIDKNGICFFHRSIKENSNAVKHDFADFDQLLSGLMSGILTASKEMLSSDIQKIESTSYKFLFFSEKSLVFVVKATLNSSDKKIKKQIKILQDLFIKKFKDKIENFDGEISSFKHFEEDLDIIFQKMTKSQKWGASLMDL